LRSRSASLSDAEEQLSKPQYIPVAKELLDRLNQFDELKIHPLETKEDFKAIIPRHLKKPWRYRLPYLSGQKC
jgi:hypothetical protein